MVGCDLVTVGRRPGRGHESDCSSSRRCARYCFSRTRLASGHVRLRTDGVRLAELVATLSYAADLGLGQPMAHCMRQTVIALRLAELAGATDAEREATYYLGLMFNVYCHADAAEQASWFGDDIELQGRRLRDARHEHHPDGGVPPPPSRRARQRSVPGPTTGRLSACRA